jgi:hypothetical protein
MIPKMILSPINCYTILLSENRKVFFRTVPKIKSFKSFNANEPPQNWLFTTNCINFWNDFKSLLKKFDNKLQFLKTHNFKVVKSHNLNDNLILFFTFFLRVFPLKREFEKMQ